MADGVDTRPWGHGDGYPYGYPKTPIAKRQQIKIKK